MRVAALFAGVAVLLAACGGGDSAGSETSTALAGGSTAPAATATATPAEARSPASAAADATPSAATAADCQPPPVDPKAGVALGIVRQADLLGLCAAWLPAPGDIASYRVTFLFPETGEERSYEVDRGATAFLMPEADWRFVGDDASCLAHSTRGVRVQAVSAGGSATVVGEIVVQSEGCGE